MDTVTLAGRLFGTRWRDIRHFASIDSTNRFLHDEAVAGRIASGTVAIADQQTAGRGRLGRSWIAPSGSALLMSVYTEDITGDAQPLLSYALSLSALDAFAAWSSAPRLKWPNDVIVPDDGNAVGYRKLCGILASGVESGVVIGIGINVHRPDRLPKELAENAASPVWLSELCDPPTLADLAERVLASFDDRLNELAVSPSTMLSSYRIACATIGMSVRVEHVDGTTLHGTATHVDERGQLVVTSADGHQHTVVASDVHHVRST